jgi:O-antigen ligase
LSLLVVIVCWTLFAFPHYYRATVLPLACGIVLLAFLRPPDIELFKALFRSRSRRAAQFLDLALILSVAAIALQLVPLQSDLRNRIAPAATAYDRAMRLDTNVTNVANPTNPDNVTDATNLTNVTTAARRPLSIEPADTLLALMVVASIVLLFWSLLAMFERGGVRATIKAVAWIGLLVSPLAIVQHLMPLPIVDAAWGLTSRGLRTFGPFVNRNDFAGWLIMAIPLTAGYGIARMQTRHRAGEEVDAGTLVDSKSLWLAMAVCLMAAGLLGSLSRSGLVGAFAGLVFFALVSRRRVTARRAGLAIVGLGLALAIASAYADMGALSTRFMEGPVSQGLSERLSIWRQTRPIVRDFWPFGAGAGTYKAVMVPYQTMSRYFTISHADNEFLQILAEGGLLLGLPVALALLAGGAIVAKRLREDHTPIFWMRAGAAAGIVALATQNMIEMTLRVPANAVLFAILAAIAIHHPASRPTPQKRERSAPLS